MLFQLRRPLVQLTHHVHTPCQPAKPTVLVLGAADTSNISLRGTERQAEHTGHGSQDTTSLTPPYEVIPS